MYSLDVNFLKDRPELSGQKPDTGGGKRQQQPAGSMLPLFAGLGVALLPLLAVGGLWFFGNQQNAELEQKVADADGKIREVDAKLVESKKIADEYAKVNEDTNALASVFYQVKPWSATLQDIRDRIPPGVSIVGITQTEVVPPPGSTPAPAPQASPGAAKAQAPAVPLFTTKLEIVGQARSYNEVNDFLLTLQRSSFLKKAQTQLVSAKLIKNPTRLELPKLTTKSNAAVTYELPDVVEYRIQTSFSDTPASELLRELDRKGAVGLVTRIRTLQDKGVNQK